MEEKTLPLEQAGKIALLTLISRLLGMVRDVFIIMALGVGADIFFMAFRIPNIMRRMTAEGVLGIGHTARLARFFPRQAPLGEGEMTKEGDALCYSFKMACSYTILAALVACLLAFFAPFIVRLIAPGFSVERLAETVFLFRWCLVYLPCAAGASILSATLIYYERAGYAACAPILLNLGIIFLGGGAFLTGKGVFFAVGVVIGGMAQLLWLVWQVRRLVSSGAWKARTTRNTQETQNTQEIQEAKETLDAQDVPGAQVQPNSWSARILAITVCVRSILCSTYDTLRQAYEQITQGYEHVSPAARTSAPEKGCLFGEGDTAEKAKVSHENGTSQRGNVATLVSYGRRAWRAGSFIGIGASSYLFFFVSSIMASFYASGGVSSLYIAERLLEFPLALIGASLGMAVMPRFIMQEGTPHPMGKALHKALDLCFFIILPASIGLAVLALPIVNLLFAQGAFAEQERILTAQVLCIMSCVLPALCISRQFVGALCVFDEYTISRDSLSGRDVTKEKISPKNVTQASFSSSESALRGMGHTVWGGCLVIVLTSLCLGSFMGLGAVAVGVVMAGWGQCLLLWRMASRRLGVPFMGEFLYAKKRLLLAGVVLALAGWWGGENLLTMESALWAGVGLCVFILLAVLVWIGGGAVAGNEEAQLLCRFFARKRPVHFSPPPHDDSCL